MRAIKRFFRFILKIFLLGAFGMGVYCVLFGLNGIYGGGNSLEHNVRKIASQVSNYIPVISDGQLISDEDSHLLIDSGVSGENIVFEDDLYPYYALLNTRAKEVYKKAYANALEYNTSFLVTNAANIDESRAAVEALFNDHPEIFWIETKYSYLYTEKGICVQIKLDYNMTPEEIPAARARFETAAQKIISGASSLSSNYDKEKYVHDYIIKSTEYDVNEELSQSAYSALVKGKSVCAGYARAFQYIMHRLGIPTYYVVGYSSGAHAWNIVKLDDGYYNVDVTWDSSWPISYSYFNRTDADFAETHTREKESLALPACTATVFRNLEHSFGQGLFNAFDKPVPREEELPQPEAPDFRLPEDNNVIITEPQKPRNPEIPDISENAENPDSPNSTDPSESQDPPGSTAISDFFNNFQDILPSQSNDNGSEYNGSASEGVIIIN